MPFTAMLNGTCGQAWECSADIVSLQVLALEKLASVVNFAVNVIHTYP